MKWRQSMYYKLSNKEKGRFGEEIAAKYLENNGYKILERNFHYSKYSEIDIVAREKDSIVFVEVKMRSTTGFGHPFEAISRKKLENIFHAAQFYLQNTKERYRSFRIDVISVIGLKECKIEHLKNISF